MQKGKCDYCGRTESTVFKHFTFGKVACLRCFADGVWKKDSPHHNISK